MSKDLPNPARAPAMCPDVPSPTEGAPDKCAQTGPNVPECAAAAPSSQICKTNPPSCSLSRPLSDRQLAAARGIVQGFGSKFIAKHLGLNHHTIGRWKRDPRFVAEVDRLRACVTEMTLRHRSMTGDPAGVKPRRLPPGATTTRRATPAGYSDAWTPGDDPEYDAMFAKIMRHLPPLRGGG